RKFKRKTKMEPYQHKFKANGTFEMKKKSRVKRKHPNEACSSLEQEQEEGTVDSSSQPLNTATLSNFSAITKEKTDSSFAEVSQEFETAEPIFDQDSE
ncbi:3057_t:CDS:1, partial [Racocetra fulgida]